MKFGQLFTLLPAAFLIALALPLSSQTVYDARQGGLPLAFGGGVSNFDPYFTQGPAPFNTLYPGFEYGRMWGVTAWADAGIPFTSGWLHNFGLEAQYQSIFAGGTTGQVNIKETSTGGGPMYTLHHWARFHPYGKYIFSLSRVDFTPEPRVGGGTYSHDSRATNSLGAGIEFRCTQHIWARAEYEYQLWGPLINAAQFQPQGLTAGVMYDLRRTHWR
jgi:opacity protein-like surface antigen